MDHILKYTSAVYFEAPHLHIWRGKNVIYTLQNAKQIHNPQLFQHCSDTVSITLKNHVSGLRVLFTHTFKIGIKTGSSLALTLSPSLCTQTLNNLR